MWSIFITDIFPHILPPIFHHKSWHYSYESETVTTSAARAASLGLLDFWKHMGIMYKLWYVMWVPSLTQYLTNFTQDAISSVSCVVIYSSLGRSDLAGLVPKQILKYFPTSFPFVPSHLQQGPASFMSSGSYTGQFIYQITTQHDEYVVKTKGVSKNIVKM